MHLDDPTIPRSIPGQVRGVQVNDARFHGALKKNHKKCTLWPTVYDHFMVTFFCI